MSHSHDGAIWLENTEMSQLKGSCKQNILRVQLGELVVVSTFFTVGKKKNGTHKRQSEAMLNTAQQESWSNTSPVFLC